MAVQARQRQQLQWHCGTLQKVRSWFLYLPAQILISLAAGSTTRRLWSLWTLPSRLLAISSTNSWVRHASLLSQAWVPKCCCRVWWDWMNLHGAMCLCAGLWLASDAPLTMTKSVANIQFTAGLHALLILCRPFLLQVELEAIIYSWIQSSLVKRTGSIASNLSLLQQTFR